MHLLGQQVVILCMAALLLGCLYGAWRGRMALRESLLLRSKEPSPYKLGEEFVYVMREFDYNRMSRRALQWELSQNDPRNIAMDDEQGKSKHVYEKLRGLFWRDINQDMLSRTRELLRWVRDSNEPTSETVAAWFAWECTQVAWHALGLETGLYPIHTQKWDGKVRSPFCTVMEQRRREEQDRNIRLMGPIADDAITPNGFAARLRDDLEAAGVKDEILTFPDPESTEGPGVVGEEAPPPKGGWRARFGDTVMTPTFETEADARAWAAEAGYAEGVETYRPVPVGGPPLSVTTAPRDAIWYNEHSPKADPAQVLDDRIQAFNNRLEEFRVPVTQEYMDQQQAEWDLANRRTPGPDRGKSFDMPASRPLESSDAPSPAPDPGHARSRPPGGSLDPEGTRDPYGSSLLNEDVADAIGNPTDYGVDLGKVNRATVPGSVAGAPKTVADTLHGNWFVISQAGNFYGPFTDRTQANDKAKGSSLVAWSLGQSSPDEFLTLCSQGKGRDADSLPACRWYMRWVNDLGFRLAGPYRTEEEAASCGKAMDLPAWTTVRENNGPGEFAMPGIYFFDPTGNQQTEIGPVGAGGSPSQNIIDVVKKDKADAEHPVADEPAGYWYVVRRSDDIANKITRREYIGPFGSREEAHAWRLSTGKWGNRDNPIKQIPDVGSILSPGDVITAPGT